MRLFYVGSTEKSVMVREHTRYRKYKQVLEDKLVSAELSIRFWAHHRNFWDWCVIPVSQTVATDVLRGREQALIQALQPPPNFPFIARWFCPRRGVIKPPDATQATKIGLSRLWRKHRKKQLTTTGRGLPTPSVRYLRETFLPDKRGHMGITYPIGQQHRGSFRSCQTASGETSSVTQRFVPSVAWPSTYQPAWRPMHCVPLLPPSNSEASFLPRGTDRYACRSFPMRPTDRTSEHACEPTFPKALMRLPPFHVPKTTVVFPRHPRVAQVLHNRQDALKQWALRREPTCKCDVTQNYAPKAPMFGGHIAAKGTEFTNSLSTLEQQIASGATTDTFFPDKEQLRTQFVEGWSNWCRTNALPGPPRGLNETFQQVWNKHLSAGSCRQS